MSHSLAPLPRFDSENETHQRRAIRAQCLSFDEKSNCRSRQESVSSRTSLCGPMQSRASVECKHLAQEPTRAVAVMRPVSTCDQFVPGEMNNDATWPEIERRISAEKDRRRVPRGGRRRFDLPRPVTCARCGARDVRALGTGLAGFWCVCRSCSNVFAV